MFFLVGSKKILSLASQLQWLEDFRGPVFFLFGLVPNLDFLAKFKFRELIKTFEDSILINVERNGGTLFLLERYRLIFG